MCVCCSLSGITVCCFDRQVVMMVFSLSSSGGFHGFVYGRSGLSAQQLEHSGRISGVRVFDWHRCVHGWWGQNPRGSESVKVTQNFTSTQVRTNQNCVCFPSRKTSIYSMSYVKWYFSGWLAELLVWSWWWKLWSLLLNPLETSSWSAVPSLSSLAFSEYR